MTNYDIAEQLYDELQHGRLTNYKEYSQRLYELLDLAHPNEKNMGEHVSEVENIAHNKWSFGFCDMCGEVIFYDEGGWYDLCGDLFDYERAKIEERLPKYQKELGTTDIQDVCASCFHKLVGEEKKMRYFTVEKEYLAGEVWRYEVNSDGTRAGDRYSVEGEDYGNKLVLGFLFQEYDEQGMLQNVEFYPVKSDISKEPLEDDTGTFVYQNNENEVLAKIADEHPAGEWQNNNW